MSNEQNRDRFETLNDRTVSNKYTRTVVFISNWLQERIWGALVLKPTLEVKQTFLS